MSVLQRIQMPEGGNERTVVWMRPHNCKNAKHFRAAFEDRFIDELEFAVGSHGEGMPMNVPFPVTSTNPCGVCGVYPTVWFEWTGRLIIP